LSGKRGVCLADFMRFQRRPGRTFSAYLTSVFFRGFINRQYRPALFNQPNRFREGIPHQMESVNNLLISHTIYSCKNVLLLIPIILNNVKIFSEFQAPWMAPATENLGKKMSYNVPLLGGLCFPVIPCVYPLLSLYNTTNYVKRFVSPCVCMLLRVIPLFKILLSYLLSILEKVVIPLQKNSRFPIPLQPPFFVPHLPAG
jgi:hypothetical protein